MLEIHTEPETIIIITLYTVVNGELVQASACLSYVCSKMRTAFVSCNSCYNKNFKIVERDRDALPCCWKFYDLFLSVIASSFNSALSVCRSMLMPGLYIFLLAASIFSRIKIFSVLML